MLTPDEWTWVLEEIAPTLEGAALQRVYEQDPDTWVLSLRQPGVTHMLLISVASDASRIHLATERSTQPQHPTTLTMTMRKWLRGMRVESVPIDHGDRLLIFRGHTSDPNFASQDPEARPERVPVSLVIEGLGGRNNLFILGEGDRVLAQQHRDALPERGLRPGGTYQRPPAPPERSVSRAGRFDEARETRSASVEAWYTEHLVVERLEGVRRALLVDIRREKKRARRLVRNIEGDLERAERAAAFRRFGELLQSAYGQIERGASSAHVPDYYEEGMPVVEVPLDPALDLKGNIAHYFRQYRRLNAAQDRIEERLLEAMERVDTLERALESARGATSPQDLEALRARLSMRTRQVHRPGTRAAPVRLPYREFRGGAGGVILVGRGRKQNDELSLKIARGRDVWMHARDWAGAHVVLRMGRGGEPSQSDMQDAALLAAHFSKGREDTLVDVTYTRAKYVKKPKGAPAGMVSVADGSTIGVRSNPERLAKVLETEQVS